MKRVLFAGAALLFALAAAAQPADNRPEISLPDPALEAKARDISRTLRCLVCQNQSIEDSNADLARDLRRIVRERIAAGDSDGQVREYLVARYGDWVLLKPPVKPETLLLWAGPGVLFVLGVAGIGLYFRRRGRTPSPAQPLSDKEREKLGRLLGGGSER